MLAPRLLGVALLAFAVAAPAASAHTTVFSDDGKYRIVVGQLEEPVVTGAKTGLDLCFTLNDTARSPVAIDPAAFEAPDGYVKLVSPDGEELSQPLRAQFGRPGCYQFEQPYILTTPGQYTVSAKGLVNGTDIELSGVNAGGSVVDQEKIRFPAGADEDAAEERGAPLPAAAWLMVGLAAMAAIRRLR